LDSHVVQNVVQICKTGFFLGIRMPVKNAPKALVFLRRIGQKKTGLLKPIHHNLLKMCDLKKIQT